MQMLKLEHLDELYPRVGFIVTNLSRSAERVTAFYNHRGTAEQFIKEGKNTIKWMRLSCCRFCNNEARLQPSLQPRKFHADSGFAQRGGALVADDTEGEAGEDWCQGHT